MTSRLRKLPMTRLVAAGARGGRLKPLPAALALMLVSGGVAMPASAQQAFSSGWFAAKNAAQTQAITTVSYTHLTLPTILLV